MRFGTANWITLAILAIAFPSASPVSMADEKPKPATPTVYASPGAVFDAYREAANKKDWRTMFFCMTPHDRVEYTIWYCSDLDTDDPKAVAVLKKYGAERETIEAEYYKRYKERHGVDIAKLIAEHEKNEADAIDEYFKKEGIRPSAEKPKEAFPVPSSVGDVGPAIPPADEKLYREVVSALITDMAGCFKAVLDVSKHTERPLGKLEQLLIRGDVATGSANTTEEEFRKELGGAETREVHVVSQTFQFRKLKEGWFIGE